MFTNTIKYSNANYGKINISKTNKSQELKSITSGIAIKYVVDGKK